MKKKLNLLSLMLLGLLSLFTSCVDGDYYELYEDEEFLSPRNKKGKEVTGMDYSNYPLMYDGDSEYKGWFEAECVACAYSNITGNTNKADCRAAIINAWGSFEDLYEGYFAAVTSRGVDHPLPSARATLADALGWRFDSPEDFLADWLNGYLSGNICVIIKGGHPGAPNIGHVGVAAVPTSVSWSWPGRRRGTIWFTITDQFAYARHDFSITVDNDFNIISCGDGGVEITGFLVP